MSIVFKRTPLDETCDGSRGQVFTWLEYDLNITTDERAVGCVCSVGLVLRLSSIVFDVGAYNLNHGTKL